MHKQLTISWFEQNISTYHITDCSEIFCSVGSCLNWLSVFYVNKFSMNVHSMHVIFVVHLTNFCIRTHCVINLENIRYRDVAHVCLKLSGTIMWYLIKESFYTNNYLEQILKQQKHNKYINTQWFQPIWEYTRLNKSNIYSTL